MRNSLAAAFFFFLAVTASAGTITSIDPASVRVNSGEHFLTIYGSGLGNVVVFDSTVGHYELNVNAAFSNRVVTWVPEAVVRTAATWSVYVRGGTGDSNVVTFQVRGFRFFPLVILMPDVLRVQPSTREGGYAKFEPYVMGGEDPSPKLDCFPASGSFFKMGTTHVQCTATNIYGERAQATLTVNVLDHEAPRVSVPAPITVRATSREGAIVDFKASATDDIYGDVIPECLPRSGSNFPIGKTPVVCSATDLDLNVGYGSFIVEVLGDRKPYGLDVLVPSTIYTDATSPDGTVVKYSVRVSGTSDPAPTLTCSHKSGGLFPVGTTSVTCDAIDSYGMRGTGAFDVIVIDPKPPSILRVAASPEILFPVDGRIYPVNIDVVVEDDIDLRPACEVFSVTANQRIDLADSDDPKLYNWAITGPMSVELRATVDAKLARDRIYTVWVGCTDFFGNHSYDTVNVTVPYGTNSTVTAPPVKRRAAGRP